MYKGQNSFAPDISRAPQDKKKQMSQHEKNGQEIQAGNLLGKSTNGGQAYEKRHLINNQENANQNYNEIVLFGNQMGRNEKPDKI